MPITNDIERLHRRIAELETRVAKLEGVTDDGWIIWSGGECPVEGNARVKVMLSKGEVWQGPAEYVLWGDIGTGGEIIAYRVVK